MAKAAKQKGKPGEGEPGSNFRYKANVISDALVPEIEELMNHTDPGRGNS